VSGPVGTAQPVVGIVGIGPGAVAGQVAVGVIGGRDTGRRCVLVEPVGSIALGPVGVTGPLVGVVAGSGGDDLLRLVSRVGPGVVLGGARKVVRQAGKRRLVVVPVADGGAVPSVTVVRRDRSS
jgi:hypothetical protein